MPQLVTKAVVEPLTSCHKALVDIGISIKLEVDVFSSSVTSFSSLLGGKGLSLQTSTSSPSLAVLNAPEDLPKPNRAYSSNSCAKLDHSANVILFGLHELPLLVTRSAINRVGGSTSHWQLCET